MNIKQILEITKGKPLNVSNLSTEVSSFTIDSRKKQKNSFFVPLKGSKFDGHLFIEDSLKNGSVGFFTEKPVVFKNGILVENNLKALTQVGIYKRNKLSKAIAITGTSGKTTVKELLSFLLKNFFPTYSTSGNYNNEIGVPLTLANIPENTRIGVFELGAGKIGDITYLSQMVRQDISVLTSVGHGHTEKFGSYENVLKGKGEIFDFSQFAVLPEQLKNFYRKKLKKYITFGENGDISYKNVYVSEYGTSGEIFYKNEKIKITVPVYNRAVFKNIAAVAGVLYFLDINPLKHLKLFEEFSPPKGRGNIIKNGNLTIIDDTYNANPLSVENAIKTISSIKGKKIIVLGDMLELGEYSEKLHREVGKLLRESPIDYLFFYGEKMKFAFEEAGRGKWFSKKEEIAKEIKNISSKEKVFVLVKGSRGMKMEDVICSISDSL